MSAAYGSGAPLVVDSSAWLRQRDDAYRERWKATVRAGRVAICPAIALELLTTARGEAAFRRLDAALAALPQAPITTSVTRAAMQAALELGARRRIPVVDYLVAAAAAERGFGVLHLNAHYDLLSEVLGFASVRLDG